MKAKYFIGVLVAVGFLFLFIVYLDFMLFPPRSAKTAEQPAKLYAIQWLSGQTDFSEVRVDAFTLASITTPKNGEMIEVIGFCRPASSDKIFGLSYAAIFFEIRQQDPEETVRFVQKGYKDHGILAVLKKNQTRPDDSQKRYSVKGVWKHPPDKKPYIEVTQIQEYKP